MNKNKLFFMNGKIEVGYDFLLEFNKSHTLSDLIMCLTTLPENGIVNDQDDITNTLKILISSPIQGENPSRDLFCDGEYLGVLIADDKKYLSNCGVMPMSFIMLEDCSKIKTIKDFCAILKNIAATYGNIPIVNEGLVCNSLCVFNVTCKKNPNVFVFTGYGDKLIFTHSTYKKHRAHKKI